MVLADEVGKNGAANGAAKAAAVEEKIGEGSMGVEELTVEDRPWFEKARASNVQVSVTPGGRWNHFKTYSVIQRTFEIWSFVIAFLVKVFERFDRDPIAAASLGQVHRARLQGREVVVKVQRPGLKDLFDIDLKNLRVLAVNLQKIDPKSDGAKRDWVAIYDECASVLYEEIDYMKEGKNADRFRENFKDMDYVKVPTIYWQYTTSQMLVMEYTPGIKINRIDALDKLQVDRKRWALGTGRVMLVMEYTPGIKINIGGGGALHHIKINRIDALDKLQVDRKRYASWSGW
ncbi:unnamed protein product [Closterium sp. NIES-53]